MSDVSHAARPLFQQKLTALFLAERALVVRLVLLSLLGALLALAFPHISRLAIDEALPKSAPRMLVVLSVALVLVGAHQAWAGWIADASATALGAKVELRALDALFGALVGSSYAELRRRDAGWLSDTLAGAGEATHAYVRAIATTISQGFFALAYLGLMLSDAPGVALAVLAVVLAIAALSWALVRWEAGLVREELDASSREQELLNRLLGALAALRAASATRRLAGAWSERVAQAAAAGIRRARAAVARTLITQGGIRVLGLGVLLWSVKRCLTGEIGVGELMLWVSAAGGLSASILALAGTGLEFRALAPQFERVNELLRSSSAEIEPPPARAGGDDRIVVDSVSHRYAEDGRWVLEQRSLEIPRGAFVRLKSPSGSGKSTLLRLMAGLMEPTRGKIRVFGLPATEARGLVLYVPQHCPLLEASIGDNLRLLSGADEARILAAAERTGLARLLESLPMGLETRVAAQGENLSSGQRQLIVLTAAFASSRPVLLLDEATSQIDVGARRSIDFGALAAGRTLVLVEHDEDERPLCGERSLGPS